MEVEPVPVLRSVLTLTGLPVWIGLKAVLPPPIVLKFEVLAPREAKGAVFTWLNVAWCCWNCMNCSMVLSSRAIVPHRSVRTLHSWSAHTCRREETKCTSLKPYTDWGLEVHYVTLTAETSRKITLPY